MKQLPSPRSLYRRGLANAVLIGAAPTLLVACLIGFSRVLGVLGVWPYIVLGVWLAVAAVRYVAARRK